MRNSHVQDLKTAFKRQIVHHLAHQPSMFTTLNINMYEVDDQTLGGLLTQILEEVAEYEPARVHTQGRCVVAVVVHTVNKPTSKMVV